MVEISNNKNVNRAKEAMRERIRRHHIEQTKITCRVERDYVRITVYPVTLG